MNQNQEKSKEIIIDLVSDMLDILENHFNNLPIEKAYVYGMEAIQHILFAHISLCHNEFKDISIDSALKQIDIFQEKLKQILINYYKKKCN